MTIVNKRKAAALEEEARINAESLAGAEILRRAIEADQGMSTRTRGSAGRRRTKSMFENPFYPQFQGFGYL